MPITTSLGWLLIYCLAAAWAASTREGVTSVARILPETSIANITVARVDGRLTTAVGLATAISSKVSASSIRAGGTCRRHPTAPIAALTMLRLA